jgi:Xaa-Pro aminopeptidase
MLRFVRGLTALVLLAAGCRTLQAQTPEEFQKRREAVRSRMDAGSVLVLRGAPAPEDGPFRQENSLYYLTGVDEPGASLILFGSRPEPPATANAAAAGPRFTPPTEYLFLPAPAPGGPGGVPGVVFTSLQAQAPPARPGQPLSRPGFRTVLPSTSFQPMFERTLLGFGVPGRPDSGPLVVYLDYQRSRDLASPLTADEQMLKQASDKGGQFLLRPTGMVIAPLRRIKQPAEVATIRRAAAITAEGLKEAMRSAEPGLYEYQLQSIIEHVFTVNGARRPGFATIVGSGKNACILHWSENTRRTEPGDLVVMDVGAEVDMYTADITRTMPISGTFTKRQRLLYETVLAANTAAIEMAGPGVTMQAINEKVAAVLGDGLIQLGLAKDKADAASKLRRYYPHGLSHSVGLEVHDPGSVATLEPGMIVTIEPGLYIPEESVGVRIEDDVLVTETGREVLTGAVPKAVAEVEALMKQGGMDFSRYLVKDRK